MQTSCPDSVHHRRRDTQSLVTQIPAKHMDLRAPKTQASLISEEIKNDWKQSFSVSSIFFTIFPLVVIASALLQNVVYSITFKSSFMFFVFTFKLERKYVFNVIYMNDSLKEAGIIYTVTPLS